MSDFSKCKICRFELNHDEGWGSQICDSCESEIEADEHLAHLDSLDDDNNDDGSDPYDDLDFDQQWAADIEAANARDSRPIGVEKRSQV